MQSSEAEIEKNKNNNFKIKKIKIKDIQPGQYALSLNEETGKIEPHRIIGLLDMGIKPIYELRSIDYLKTFFINCK